MTAVVTRWRWVDVVEELAPTIAREAGPTNRDGDLTRALIDAFTDAELYWMLLPRSLGGGEASIVEGILVIERVTQIDASVGWSLMAAMAATTTVSGFVADAAVEEMFGGATRAIAAGQLAPRGQATAIDGGLRVSGRFGFASGSVAATYMTAGAIVMENGERVRIDGHADARVVVLPKSKVEMQGNWNVLGLEGTGSVDYELNDVEVGDAFTFPLINPKPARPGTVYRLTSYGLGAFGHGAVALGIAGRAIEEITRIAKTKQRLGQDGLSGQQLFLHELGRHDAAYQAIRATVIHAYRSAEEHIVNDGAIHPLDYARMRQAVTYATNVAADIVRFAYTWSGSDGLRVPSTMSDLLRHMSAATQHIFVDPSSMVDAARAVLAASD